MQQNLHPMLVHFHIALLIAAFGFEALGSLLRRQALRHAGFYALLAGFAGLAISLPTGLWAAALPSMSKSALVHAHRDLALATAAVFTAVVALRVMLARSTKPRTAAGAVYAVLLVCGIALTALTAHYGARVVWG